MRLIDADKIPWTDLNDDMPNTKIKVLITFAEKVNRMPTVEERKTGKWIPHIEKSREYIGTFLVNVTYDYWFCDACGYRVDNGRPMYNFCPHCGADMRGGT